MQPKHKWWIALMIIGLLLIIARILLPSVVKKFLNDRLQQIDPYTGHISDVDIHLYRGAYVIDSLVIEKKGIDSTEPFLELSTIDLSIQWRSLLKGALVGQIRFSDPVLNFAMQEDTAQNQLGSEFDWTELVKDFMPIQINSLQVINADINFIYTRDTFVTSSKIILDSVELSNIRNIDDPDHPFPSKFFLRGNSASYEGKIVMDGRANFLRLVPDFDYNLEVEKIKLTTLNPWFKYFTDMTFEKGTLDLYSEMVAKDGTITGYLKPILNDATVYNLVEKDRSFWQAIKELFTEGGQEILENKKLETTGTKIPINGNLENPQTSFWPTFIGFVRNAYWKALLAVIDHSISADDRGVVIKEDQSK